jgi:hypothetical protein
MLLAALIAATAISGCAITNGFFAQQPAVYNITVKATSVGLQHFGRGESDHWVTRKEESNAD